MVKNVFEKNGLIVLNKPTGMSSSLAVQIVKRAIKPNKIGHLGTLDPLGSGVLVLAVNKATKLFDEYLQKTKTYKAVFYFGKETDTLDSEGKVVSKNDVNITLDEVINVAKQFVGEFEQLPPKYSAKKLNGKKAYELARQGKDVELKTRHVTIYSCEVLYEVAKNTFMFEITCSGGTYIRSICRDIAYKLSTYGTMLAIIRTRCGDFKIQDSFTLEEIKQDKYDFVEITKGE